MEDGVQTPGMANAEGRFFRRMFVALVAATFGLVLIGTFYTAELKLSLDAITSWVFATFPIGWMIILGTLAFMGIVCLAAVIYSYQWLRRLYWTLTGQNYRRYDDPKFQE